MAALARPERQRERAQDKNASGSSPYIWALKDINFDVKEGEVVGLIGRNGAGKSTLLKILARVTRPTEGHAELHGRIGSLLEVGTGFHPELTGRENVFMSGAVLGMRAAEIRRKFDEIVAFSEVERFLDTPLKHYSSGMQVRLAFAVAAHLEPEILLRRRSPRRRGHCLSEEMSRKDGRRRERRPHNYSRESQHGGY